MRRTLGGAAILAAVMALTPLQTIAQQGRMGRMGGRGMGLGLGMTARADSLRGPGAEGILRLKDQLALTDDQVKRLDQLREEVVKQRTAHMAQMEELRSKLLAGEIKPEDLRTQMQAQRDATASVRAQQLQRAQGVLNDAQRQKIDELQAQARAFRMGRRSAMRGGRPGVMGGGRGGMMRGRGFGPRMQPGMWRRGGFGQGMGSGMGPGVGQQQAPARMARPPFRGRGGTPPDTVPPVGG
jgi:hypothetical protein